MALATKKPHRKSKSGNTAVYKYCQKELTNVRLKVAPFSASLKNFQSFWFGEDEGSLLSNDQ